MGIADPPLVRPCGFPDVPGAWTHAVVPPTRTVAGPRCGARGIDTPWSWIAAAGHVDVGQRQLRVERQPPGPGERTPLPAFFTVPKICSFRALSRLNSAIHSFSVLLPIVLTPTVRSSQSSAAPPVNRK